MNTNSNLYTVIYATILVVFVASVLAFVSTSLKDIQQKNIETETMRSILSSVNLTQGIEYAPDKTKFIEDKYKKHIVNSYVVNAKGEKIEGNAFNVNLKAQYDIIRQKFPKLENLTLPIYICELTSGEKVEILSVYGAGLWGPIWGYIALNSDYNVIYGATFGHKGETPGLGAEISTPEFSNQLVGKEIFDNETFTSVSIVKGGNTEDNPHQIDAISGGTITCQALGKAITSWLKYYLPYIDMQREAIKDAEAAALAAIEAEAATVAEAELGAKAEADTRARARARRAAAAAAAIENENVKEDENE